MEAEEGTFKATKSYSIPLVGEWEGDQRQEHFIGILCYNAHRNRFAYLIAGLLHMDGIVTQT